MFAGGKSLTSDCEIAIDRKRVAYDETLSLVEAYRLINNGRYRSRDFLERFKDQVMPNYEWTEANHLQGKCRAVVPVFPSEILKAIEAEITQTPDANERVYFVGGQKFSSSSMSKDIEREIEEAQLHITEETPAMVVEIMNYMNSLPSNRFTKVVSHIDEAREVARSYFNPKVRNSQLMVLESIRDQPKPIYAPTYSKNTVRLFSVSSSLQSLKSSIRSVMTPAWYELDLRNAQLAIVSTLWDVPYIRKYMLAGKSAWDEFVTLALGNYNASPGIRADLKRVIKELVYSIVFGMSDMGHRINYQRELNYLRVDSEAYQRVMSHPLLQEVLLARNKQLYRRIGHTVIDSFKRPRLIVADNPNEAKGEIKARTYLAQQAQETEMQLVYPVFELAKQTKAFTVMLYSFDGLSIHFRDKRRITYWQKVIARAVQAKAKELGIPTGVEWKA